MMKKLVAVFLIVLLISAIAFADEITEVEQEYLGGWAMYADLGATIYHYTITFLDNHKVVLHTYSFKNGSINSDNTSSGIWGEFSGSIIFTLSGKDMQGHIDENGVLFINFWGERTAAGAFVKCPDMSYTYQ